MGLGDCRTQVARASWQATCQSQAALSSAKVMSWLARVWVTAAWSGRRSRRPERQRADSQARQADDGRGDRRGREEQDEQDGPEPDFHARDPRVRQAKSQGKQKRGPRLGTPFEGLL